MLNVLQVCSDTNIGGAGKCILTYLKHCDKKSFNVAVVLPANSLLKPKVEALGFKVIEVSAMADKSLDLSAIKKLLSVFREFRPHIVHTHGSMSARIAARLFGAKVVFTRHTVYPPPLGLTKAPGKIVSSIINNLTADKIIAVAEAAKENLTAIGVSEKKIEIILNGVESMCPISPEDLEKLKSQYGITEGTKSCAIIARLDEIKGHRYFIEAAQKLKSQNIPAKFFIAGTGPMEASIKKQISDLGLQDTVIMLGFLDNVEPLLNLIDVQCNCSTTEATSLSLLEGMSLSKPAVVSSAGGNPAVISDGKNGFVTPVGDSEKLAERLKTLFTDSQLYDEMSKASKEIFNLKFTSQMYAKSIENIYFSLGGKQNG